MTGYAFVDAQFPRVLTETGLLGLGAFVYLLVSVFRMLRSREFHCAEMSLSSYVMTLGAARPPFVAIPAFPSRFFRHSCIFVSAKSGIQRPEDLTGKRIGVPEYQMTAAVWIRGILADEYDGIGELEVVVVDDGSRDRTAQIAGQIAGVRLIRHAQNQGYGAALKTGFSQSLGDLIGFLDADGTYPPEYFPQLCQKALAGRLVVGSRMAGADSEMPLTRRVGNVFFAKLLTVMGRERVSDSASGMRVFKREVLERLYPLPDGLNLTPVMSTRAVHEGLRMSEVAIPYSERVGRSKLSVVRDGSEFLQSMIWTVLEYNSVRILGIIGLAGVLFAGVVGLGW